MADKHSAKNHDTLKEENDKKTSRTPIARKNLWDLLREIEEDAETQSEHDRGRVTVYRGHGSSSYKLKPSLFRDPNQGIRDNENTILRDLITRHPEDFLKDMNVFENLVRMQHYGLPTRLLDMTYNPLIAIYFACEGNRSDGWKNGSDAEVISITVDENKFKYYDSDTVHCLANLANLTSKEKKAIEKCKNDADLKERGSAGQRLVDFIRQHRPNFAPRIKLADLYNVYLVSPKLNNPRIHAQDGAFLIFGMKEGLGKAKRAASGLKIKRYRIDKKHKSGVQESLKMLGIKESLIYPSLDKTVEQIKKEYMEQNG